MLVAAIVAILAAPLPIVLANDHHARAAVALGPARDAIQPRRGSAPVIPKCDGRDGASQAESASGNLRFCNPFSGLCWRDDAGAEAGQDRGNSFTVTVL